jgi:large subunit ribosomal protein L4
MPQTTLKKSDGSGAGSAVLSEKLFGAKINKGLIHQAVLTEVGNSRQGTQSTKTRGTVHHTTRKPYKQKGTGRARQGMTSAPHYRHGGVAMGPLPRNVQLALPKKMRRAAIAAALTSKAQDDAIVVLESLDITAISTKTAFSLLLELGVVGQQILLVIPENNPVVYKSFRNIPGVVVKIAPGFSTRDVLKAKTILFTQESLAKIESVWAGDKD